ncbi:MAG: TRAP transporter large permease subunit [Bilophila wadsworthia]
MFLPIMNALGIHPIRLASCLYAGNRLTPPFGANLFITMKITDVKLEEVALRAFPYLLAMWLLIIVVAACPDFVMFLPRLLM